MRNNITIVNEPMQFALIQLAEKHFDKCQAFAEEVYTSNRECYQGRRQTIKEEVIRQIITGKMAEWAVYYYVITKLSLHCNEPDHQVYRKKYKSFAPDLLAGHIESDAPVHNIHVKSILVTQAKKFGLSWILEKNDPMFRSEKKETLALCQVINKKTVLFHGFLDIGRVRLGEPKKTSLESKYALYFQRQDIDSINFTLH